MAKKKKLITTSTLEPLTCSHCNPKAYLKFNFSFCTENGKVKSQDAIKLLERLKFFSSEKWRTMQAKYVSDKKQFIEYIPTNQLRKEVPREFREFFKPETNEHYSVFRIYPAGTPKGTANPRVIGMIKNTIFYIFFIDWKGTLYNH